MVTDIFKEIGGAIEGFTKPTPGQRESEEAKKEAEARLQCEARGGTWDPVRKVCILPEKKPEPTPEPTPKPKEEEVITPPKVPVPPGQIEVSTTHGPKGGTMLSIGDQTYLANLSPEEIQQVAAGQARKYGIPENAAPVGTAKLRAELQAQGQQLAADVGKFGPLGIDPTGLDVKEAVTTGIVGAIPRALGLAASGAAAGAAIGAVGGPAAPITVTSGAVIGAVGGFVSGLASSMIGNFKSQRTDTTTAQQRVLDEGKQTMKDWATLAKNDPTNRAFYLAQYNKQSALIDQAFRQMKLDTSRDVAKFETALPNLAEFNSFYSPGGERDTLNDEMLIALTAPLPEGYDLFELAERRKDE